MEQSNIMNHNGTPSIKRLILFLMLSALFYHGFGQDVQQVLKAKPVTVTGGFNINGTAYSQSGGNSRRDPFSYQLSANLNFNFFGIISAPFSAYITSENKTFSRPSYQQFGISPSYKWITVHAGWRNMEFSPYTLSGSTFLGVGVELQPETFPVRGKVVYGRFAKKAVVGDTISSYISDPVYNRWGYGAMLSVGPLKNSVDLILFKAADKKEDELFFRDSLAITPQENLVLGISTRQQITKYVNLNVQYSVSAYTDDTRTGEREFSTYTYLNNLKPLYTPRYSSRHSSAFVAGVNFQTDAFTVGLDYSRIAPGYQSMGTLYLNNDVEDVKISAATSLLQGKLSLSGSGGVQSDNLDGTQTNKSRRVIFSFNGSYRVNQNLNVNANYSNYNSTTEPSRVLIEDSIKYAQVSQNLSTGVNYSLQGDESWGHNFNAMYSRQTVNTINTEFTAIEKTGTVMNNGTFGYRMNYKPLDMGISASFTVSNYVIDSVKNVNYGPQVSANKSFFDRKVKTSLSYSLQCSVSDNAGNGYVNVFRLTAGYNHGKHHSINFNANIMRRNTQPQNKERTKSSELIANLTYAFRF